MPTRSKSLKRSSKRASKKITRSKAKSRTSKAKSRTSKARSKASKKNIAKKLSKAEMKINDYKKTHKLLKLSDFKNLSPSQPVRIAFINYGDDKIEKFVFKYSHVEPVKGKQKKWYSYNIFGKSNYTMDLPLGVLNNGKIRYAQSSDYSDAYLDSPIVQTKSVIKKSSRPSPSESAKLFKTGTKKMGNDGNTWMIAETNSGVKRWKLIK